MKQKGPSISNSYASQRVTIFDWESPYSVSPEFLDHRHRKNRLCSSLNLNEDAKDAILE